MILIIIRLIIFLALTLVLFPFQLIIFIFIKKFSYLIPYFFHKICSVIFGIKINTYGKVPKNFPKLLVCNHASYLDILILGSLIKTSFVAKKEVSSWPLLGILAKLQNTIFIDRKISSLTMQKNKIIKHLQEKKNLIIFPEGTSSDGNKVLPFKSSLFNIFEENKGTKIFLQTITIVYKKINGKTMSFNDRKKITWHSDMNLITNIFDVLKKFSIEVDVIFNDEFLPNKNNNRKKIARYCWNRINNNLINSLNRK